jgi:replication factor A1
LSHKRSIGEYLAFLSLKYQLDPEKFLAALQSAKTQGKHRCSRVAIECRGKIGASWVYLLLNEEGVIAQFRIPEAFLRDHVNSLSKYMETTMVRNYRYRESKISCTLHVRDVHPGMRNVNLSAKVLEVTPPRRVVTRFGNYASVAKAVIEDETGTIKLCLWNAQIGTVAAGDFVQLTNATASTFRGERQLSIGAKGKLHTLTNPKMKGSPLYLPHVQV